MPTADPVRRATPADRESLILLNPGLHHGGRGPERTFRALADRHVLAAEVDGRVVGYLAFDYCFFDRGFVEYLIVHPDYRRRGLGAALMRAAAGLCETRDLFTSTNESNKPMQAVLTSLGYKHCGTIGELDPGDPEWFYVLHKEPRTGVSVAAIRAETAQDASAIHAVNLGAFPTHAEADLVDALRAAGVSSFVSLVAELDGRVVGHVLFTPVEVVGLATWSAVALVPMAVLPEFQNRSIGTQLVQAGLKACLAGDHNVVAVLGHPEFYPRFGFRRMSKFGLTCEFEARDEVLMVAELAPGAIAGRTGEVRYHPLFKTV